MEPFVIIHPQEVAVARAHLAEPEVFRNVEALSVVGGERLPENVRFSYGFRSPAVVGLVMGDRSRHRLTDVEAVLVSGGDSADRPQAIGGGNSSRLLVDPGEVGLGQIVNEKASSRYIDEVDKYLQDKEKAARAAGGDEFYTRVHMQRAVQDTLHKEAAFARINPPSLTNFVLANSASVKTGDDPVQVAQWAGHDAETGPVTITLGPIVPLSLVTGEKSGSIFRPYAIITFGTSGASFKLEVDIGTGCQLTVSGSFVTVSVAMQDNTAPAAAVKAGVARLSGMISFHPIVRVSPLTRTVFFDTAVAQNQTTQRLAIPAFARSFRFIGYGATAATVNVLDALGVLNYSIGFGTPVNLSNGNYIANDVPLTPDAAFVSVTDNNNPGGFGGGYCIFTLAL